MKVVQFPVSPEILGRLAAKQQDEPPDAGKTIVKMKCFKCGSTDVASFDLRDNLPENADEATIAQVEEAMQHGQAYRCLACRAPWMVLRQGSEQLGANLAAGAVQPGARLLNRRERRAQAKRSRARQ